MTTSLFAALVFAIIALTASSTRVEARVRHRHRHHKVHRPAHPVPQPIEGQFLSDGATIDDFHCAPASTGPHAVVLLIHGCAPKGFGVKEFKRMCGSLAEHDYYAMFVEYYGRAHGQPNCRSLAMYPASHPGLLMPIPDDQWVRTLIAAGKSLANNPKADINRVGLVGFSFGGTLAILEAVLHPNVADTIVDYYGFSNERVEAAVRQAPFLPATLILQGDADSQAHSIDAIHLDRIIGSRQKSHELHVYPRVEHGFNFPAAPGYDRAAADDAWKRTLTFLDRHLK